MASHCKGQMSFDFKCIQGKDDIYIHVVRDEGHVMKSESNYLT